MYGFPKKKKNRLKSIRNATETGVHASHAHSTYEGVSRGGRFVGARALSAPSGPATRGETSRDRVPRARVEQQSAPLGRTCRSGARRRNVFSV